MATLAPAQWFDRLQARFTAPTAEKWQDKADRPCDPKPRNEQLDLLWSYYKGDPPLPQVADEFQDIFRDLLRKARCNYAEMCVTAVTNRMDLLAVSTGVDDSANGDDRAAELMEESGFAAQLKDLLDYYCAMGEAYAMVVPTVFGPIIHAIDPRRCVGIADPDNPTRLRAVLVKSYDVEADEEIAHLFLKGEKWTLQRDGSEWKRLSDKPEEITGLDELGGIPVVRFLNKHGLGEYEAHIDVLDRIIDDTLTRLVMTKFQAFKQRGVSGDEDEEDEYDTEEPVIADGGQPTKQVTDWNEVFKAGPGAVWKVPAGWQFWEGNQADMGPLLQAKRDDVKEFAAVTHTPLYLITPDDANGSAQGAGLLREALTSKVRDRRARVVPGLKLLWRIVFAMDGDASRGKKIKLHWGPIEFNSLAEKGSASAQATSVLSRRKVLEKVWEMDPADIEENELEMAAQAILDGAQQPPPPPTQSGSVPPVAEPQVAPVAAGAVA